MKTKQTLTIIIATLALTACGVQKMSQTEKLVRQTLIAQETDSLVKSRRFGVEVSAVFPQGASMRHLNYDYGIQVHGDTLRSYLPYFGRAYEVPYGGGKGLDFSEPMKRWTLTEMKKGEQQMKIWVENEEDSYVYTLHIYPSGVVDLTVDSRQRDRIRYNGNITRRRADETPYTIYNRYSGDGYGRPRQSSLLCPLCQGASALPAGG